MQIYNLCTSRAFLSGKFISLTQIVSQPLNRRIVNWPVFLGVGSLLTILFSSPLFRTLGFEYSAISALLLSVACGFSAAASSQPAQAIQSLLSVSLRRSVLFAGIPLLIPLLSVPFLPNCAFGEGVRMYLLIAVPAALLAGIFGTAIGGLATSRKSALWLFAGFWLLTFVFSLIPGYLFPQLFTYGWQYGYFPGLVWDEYIEPRGAYGWHLLEWATLALILLLFAVSRQGTPLNKSWWLKLGSLGIVYTMLLWTRAENGVATTHAKVENHLSSQLRVDSHTVIYYRGTSLTLEEVELLRLNALWYLHDIRTRLELTDTTREIAIYLYPTAESLYRLVGTRNASIAKPWLSELHIAKENLESLKHELVHVLLREWAGFPLHASWSTALTEGVAMSLEPSYDGIHSLHEHSCAILRMKLGTGVSNIMGFAGFASGASTTSYVLAGSFTSYLLDTYGPQKLKQVYGSLDFEEAYGKPLAQLENEWKAAIGNALPELTYFDSLRTRYYFDRQSILFVPCLRSIGKLNTEARTAMEEGMYAKAEKLYAELYRENKSINALRGIVISMLRRDQKERVRQLLDTATIGSHPQAPTLYLFKGDVLDDRYYDTLMMARLSGGNVLTAIARKYVPEKDRYLKDFYTSRSALSGIPPVISDSIISDSKQRISALYLTAEAYRDEGMLERARGYYSIAINEAEKSGVDSLLVDLMRLRLLSIDPYLTVYSGLSPTHPGIQAELRENSMRAKFLEILRLRDANPSVQ